MLKVTEAVQNIEKKGHNSFSNYDYVRAVDVIAGVQKELVSNKIYLTISEKHAIFTEEAREKGGFNHYTDLGCIAKFINAEKPDEFIEVEYNARASDTGDKDIYKAKTNGLKYLLTQQFMLVTDVLIDAEDNKYDTHNEAEKPKEEAKKEEKPKDKKNTKEEIATKIQVDKIDKLVKAKDNPTQVMDRIMTEYNVGVYNELTKKQADEVIARLEKKAK
jgi:hypothetical protein